ncbi:VNG_1110C family protein [Haladaptatus halobius]|uniref:VNG_1110C family protein n=1 Tax=Haladaptatus halobius TaxID=2884875 RepID=UPI001D0BBA02|nr:hypothetical protein [Haladaptatus halobius]
MPIAKKFRSQRHETATSSLSTAVAQLVTDASWFRDNTQLVLPKGRLADYRNDLERQFMITIIDEQDTVRLIGSPVVIIDVRNWLTAKGIVID